MERQPKGTNSAGTDCQIPPSGTLTTLYTFCSHRGRRESRAALVKGAVGIFTEGPGVSVSSRTSSFLYEGVFLFFREMQCKSKNERACNSDQGRSETAVRYNRPCTKNIVARGLWEQPLYKSRRLIIWIGITQTGDVYFLVV